MTEAKIQEQLTWFTFSLAAQRNNLSKIFLRLRSIGARAGTSTTIHHKFIRLMDQVAVDQAKELNLICDIEKMEKRHALMRQQRMLQQANETNSAKNHVRSFKPVEQPEEKPARRGLYKILALLTLFSHVPHHHKNQ